MNCVISKNELPSIFQFQFFLFGFKVWTLKQKFLESNFEILNKKNYYFQILTICQIFKFEDFLIPPRPQSDQRFAARKQFERI